MENELTAKGYLKSAIFQKNIGNFCANYYNLFIKSNQNSETSLENFILLLEWNGNSNETFKIPEMFSNEEYQNTIKNNIESMVQKIVDNLVAENLEEKCFYGKIYKKISDDELFATELEKICAIIVLVLEPRIPYFKLGQALQMENDKFKEISDSIYKAVSKAYFALQYGYTQKTELASQLYNIVKELKNEEERIVLVANILGYFNSQLNMLYNRLKANDTVAENDDN